MLQVKFIVRQLVILQYITLVKCSIAGLSYMDPINNKPVPSLYPRGQDPCNPLYWYPRNIPDYCEYTNIPVPNRAMPALPTPKPVSIPHQNIIMSIPTLPVALPGLAPLPYGIPFAASNPTLSIGPPVSPYPYASNPYANYMEQTGMVPGLPGLVTKDGGINILPFSDVYSDLIEKHKNQMIRRRLKKLIQEYEDFPNGRNYRRLRNYARRNM